MSLVKILLLLVVILVGVAIIVPQHASYTPRAAVTQGVGSAAFAKTVINEYYAKHGVLPGSSEEAGIKEQDYLTGYVKGFTVGANGIITVTYQSGSKLKEGAQVPEEFPVLQDHTLIFIPAITPESIEWSCTEGTLPGKYRTANCR